MDVSWCPRGDGPDRGHLQRGRDDYGTVADLLVVFNGRTEITGMVGEDVIVQRERRAALGVAGGRRRHQPAGSADRGRGHRRGQRRRLREGGISERHLRRSPRWWLAYSVSTLVLGLVLLLLAPGLDPASIRLLRDRLGGTIGFGLLVFVVPDRRRPAVRDDRRDPTRAVPAPRARARVLDRLRGRRACSRPARRQGGLLPVPGLPGRMGRVAVDRPHPLPRRARLARRDGVGSGDAVGRADEAGSHGTSCYGTGSSVTPMG